jgi:hypothetical protein
MITIRTLEANNFFGDKSWRVAGGLITSLR